MSKGPNLSAEMDNLLVFVPLDLCKEQPGYLFGRVVYDASNRTRKFYVTDVCRAYLAQVDGTSVDPVGYYWGTETTDGLLNRRRTDWINVHQYPSVSAGNADCQYYLRNITINGEDVTLTFCNAIVVMYDQSALQGMELLVQESVLGSHFFELIDLLQNTEIRRAIKRKPWYVRTKEVLLVSQMLLCLYAIIFLTKFIGILLPLLKYSSLGLHIHHWLINMRWMATTVIKSRRFTLKTANSACAVTVDILLGILVHRFLSHQTGDKLSSDILLDNAQVVVESLKDLINWLTGAPAGLKLNHAYNETLAKFFLYHIHLWWAFLVFTKPMMDFAFNVLLLFGRLGITFQISIAADLLALISFHSYCIYVYAARLFNIQLRGLAALFRLFLGKKVNPLRERVDSCQYQTDQLFVGTLLFTILLFLMPTTWVYYVVFSIVRLSLIGLNGFLTRLKVYLKAMPVYAFASWLLRARPARTTITITLHPQPADGHITLIASTSVSSWADTWKMCVPDTVMLHSPIEWGKIFGDLLRGQLLYPL